MGPGLSPGGEASIQGVARLSGAVARDGLPATRRFPCYVAERSVGSGPLPGLACGRTRDDA